LDKKHFSFCRQRALRYKIEKKAPLEKKTSEKQQVEHDESARPQHKEVIKKQTDLMELNKEQLRAVKHDKGPLMMRLPKTSWR
jgi:hypothetical protein